MFLKKKGAGIQILSKRCQKQTSKNIYTDTDYKRKDLEKLKYIRSRSNIRFSDDGYDVNRRILCAGKGSQINLKSTFSRITSGPISFAVLIR